MFRLPSTNKGQNKDYKDAVAALSSLQRNRDFKIFLKLVETNLKEADKNLRSATVNDVLQLQGRAKTLEGILEAVEKSTGLHQKELEKA